MFSFMLALCRQMHHWFTFMPISMCERSAKGTSLVTSSHSNTAKLHMSADLLLMSSGFFCKAKVKPNCLLIMFTALNLFLWICRPLTQTNNIGFSVWKYRKPKNGATQLSKLPSINCWHTKKLIINKHFVTCVETNYCIYIDFFLYFFRVQVLNVSFDQWLT